MDNGPTWKIFFQIRREDVMEVMSILEGNLQNEPTSISAFEDTSNGTWYADALFVNEPNATDFELLLDNLEHGPITVEPLPDEDWVAKSLEGLKPVSAGRFYIYGIHNEIEASADRIPILVGAGQAFGTGHHPTTLGCLQALDEVPDVMTIHEALDLGCGTGILAVALAKISRARILASDIDPIAIEVADQVIKDNDADGQIETLVATGFEHATFKEREPFNFVFANILARPLIELAEEMAEKISPRGILILSGLLATQENNVVQPYLANGFTLRRRIPLEEWMTLVLER